MTLAPSTLSAVHLAAQEAMREMLAPVGSQWRHPNTGEVWHVVERTGATVLLRLPGERRHKAGLLHLLLRNYIKVTPCSK